MAGNISSPRSIIKAASACVWRGEEILLIQRGQRLGHGLWSLPGGKIENGESALAASVRELFEETRIVAALRLHVGDFNVDAGNVRYTISCYTGHYVSGDAAANSDAKAIAWVPWQNISAFSLAPNISEAVALARNLTSV